MCRANPAGVPGMGVPADLSANSDEALHSSPVQLFIEGAQRVVPAFSPKPFERVEILQICRSVQGMPLAILLAAAWMRLLSPAEIAAEIASNSLEFLEGEWQDVPDRQRSLRAVFDHSWDLLSEREREIFVGLSVFRGGFTYPAAQSITGVTLRELLKLVNNSLIERGSTSQQPGASGRYELHELLRQYGEEKLLDYPNRGQGLRDRHVAWYAAALQRWAGDLKRSHQLETLVEMDQEIDNIRAAWNWSIERNLVDHLEMEMEGLGLFYRFRMLFTDGIQVFQQAVNLYEDGFIPDQPEHWVTWASLLAWLDQLYMDGWLDESLGYERIDQSLELLEKAELAGLAGLAGLALHRQRAFSLYVMGVHQYHDSKLEKARKAYNESLAYYRDLDNSWAQATILKSLARISYDLGNTVQAADFGRQSVAFFQSLGAQKDINECRLSCIDI